MTVLAVLGTHLLWTFGFMAGGGGGLHVNAAAVARQDIAVGASAGCSQDWLDWTAPEPDSTTDVHIGDRRYLLYIPVNYDPGTPAPLILSYHGGTRTAESQQALDLLSTTYFNEDHIVVYPNGINVS